MSKHPRIEIKSSTKFDRIWNWCQLGLEHRIHFRDSYGLLETWYRKPSRIETMAVAFCGDVPVGVAVVLKNRASGIDGLLNIGTYVKYNYRRCGIGTSLARRAKKRSQQRIQPSRWDRQAESFYDAASID